MKKIINRLCVLLFSIAMVLSSTIGCLAMTIIVDQDTTAEVPEDDWYIVSSMYTSPDIDGGVRDAVQHYIDSGNCVAMAYDKSYNDYWVIGTTYNDNPFLIDDLSEAELIDTVKDMFSSSTGLDMYDYEKVSIKMIGEEKYIVIPMKEQTDVSGNPMYGVTYMISTGDIGYSYGSYSVESYDKAAQNIEPILESASYLGLTQTRIDTLEDEIDSKDEEYNENAEIRNMIVSCGLFVALICWLTIRKKMKKKEMSEKKTEENNIDNNQYNE